MSRLEATVVDATRVHAMASPELGDLLDFCDVVSRAATAR